MIKRYDAESGCALMQSSEGEYVLYKEYIREVELLNRKLENKDRLLDNWEAFGENQERKINMLMKLIADNCEPSMANNKRDAYRIEECRKVVYPDHGK